MSTELLNYCLEQLHSRPRALNISQPLDLAARNSFARFWAKARFEAQQQSILLSPPDHPYYGRGYLWPYELRWRERDDDTSLLRIEFNLNAVATPRELILLAAVSESFVPFNDAAGLALSITAFKGAKTRMLGREGKRTSGAVAPRLRPLVANVQYTCQGGAAYLTAVNPPDVVDIEP